MSSTASYLCYLPQPLSKTSLLMFILFSVSSAIDLCKLLKDKLQTDELVMKVLFDKVSSSSLFYANFIDFQFNVDKKHGYC